MIRVPCRWLLVTALLMPTHLFAQSTGSASTGLIEVAGNEPVRCGAAFDQASAVINLVGSSSQSVGVTLQCNSPFRLTARSTNGELRNQDQYAAGNPRTYVPYRITWPASLLDDNGDAIAPGFSASGAAWAGSLNASSAPTRQVQRGDMLIQWTGAIEVLAGPYVDTFYLEIIAD